MKKLVIGAAVALATLPMAVSAASIPALAIFGGQTQVWGNPNQSVQVTLRVNANAGEVVHAIRTDVLGDNLATVCQDVSNFEGAQNKDVPVSVTLPPNTGDYGFEAVIYTAANLQQANALTGDAACTGAGNGTFSQGNVVHVIPSGSGGTGGTSTQTLEEKIAAIVVATLKAMGLGAPAPAPAVSAECTAYAKVNAGTMSNATSDQNAKLQGFLLSQGASIPALSAGAAFGFYGNQTTAAVGWFNSIFHCA